MVVSDGAYRIPHPLLRPYVRPYEGYLLRGHCAGEHVGMPSPYLTVIVAIEPKVEIARAPRQDACRFETLASGISSKPVTIAHDGNQHGIQLSLTASGSRALLGVPTAALGDWIVGLHDLLGADAVELRERVCAETDWNARFDVVDEILLRRLLDTALDPVLDPNLTRAWELLIADASVRVGEVAEDVGWSRRHLISKFTAEFGVAPKESARIARFHRSHRMLRRTVAPSMAATAADCGYFDQSHMTREWREMAGMAPTVWREREVFAFVQDRSGPDVQDLPT